MDKLEVKIQKALGTVKIPSLHPIILNSCTAYDFLPIYSYFLVEYGRNTQYGLMYLSDNDDSSDNLTLFRSRLLFRWISPYHSDLSAHSLDYFIENKHILNIWKIVNEKF